MANRHLKFFDKKGEPLNFEYVGATASAPLTYNFNYESRSTNSTPPQGRISLFDIASNVLYMNKLDMNGYDLTSWANTVNDKVSKGGKITLKITFYPSNILQGEISSISISGSILTVNLSRVIGVTTISNDNTAYVECITSDLPGGYFTGSIFFDPVSAGLYENEQIFIVQQFKDSVTGSDFLGVPHTGSTGSSNDPLWRTRWENDTYGNTDVSDIVRGHPVYKSVEQTSQYGKWFGEGEFIFSSGGH